MIVEDGTDDALLIAREQQRIGQGEQPPSLLTRCQREILQLVAEGRSTQDVARKLNLGAKTVKPHRSQLMERLGIFDVARPVRFAIRHGFMGPRASAGPTLSD